MKAPVELHNLKNWSSMERLIDSSWYSSLLINTARRIRFQTVLRLDITVRRMIFITALTVASLVMFIHVSAGISPIQLLSFHDQSILNNDECSFNFSDYRATCPFPSSYLQLIGNDTALRNHSAIKMIRFSDGQTVYQGCTRLTPKCRESPRFDEKLNVTLNLPPCCRRNLLEVYQEVIGQLEKYQITYCLSGGSLLGYLRHEGKMIPYDDDVDLIVFDEHRKLFQAKVKPWLIDKCGRRVHETYYNKYQTRIEVSLLNRLTVDLFWFSIGNDTVYMHSRKRKYPVSKVFPLQRAVFENLLVNIPRDPIAVVVATYGGNWNTTKQCKKKAGHNCL